MPHCATLYYIPDSQPQGGGGAERRPLSVLRLGQGCLGAVLRSVFIISNRKISNRASQILEANMLLICPYCLKFQIARVKAAKTNMKF